MTRSRTLDFERPIVEIERKIDELRGLAAGTAELAAEIERLERRAEERRAKVFGRLTPWQRVQLARHLARPRPAYLLTRLVDEFTELFGDRHGGDDPGLVAGLGFLDRRPVAVLAHGRGRRVGEGRRWSDPPVAAGLRKACRVAELAGRFDLPLCTVVDVASDGGAAQPGLGPVLWELGALLAELPTPTCAVITGECYGPLGWALVQADRVLMARYAVAAPVTPETCAATAFARPDQIEAAAASLRLSAEDVHAQGLCDEVLEEPPGGAHRDPGRLASTLATALRRRLGELAAQDPQERIEHRRARLASLGQLIAVSK